MGPKAAGEQPGANAATRRQVAAFRGMLGEWYRQNRRTLPWRETRDPYAILVSEIMLQQTRVERVLAKYGEFLDSFPDFATLAAAPLATVLAVWQGLGYNRRAVALKKCAEAVIEIHDGSLPVAAEELEKLPGIGPYTARAIAAFASDAPAVFIETNIRTVFIHHFFHDRHGVTDREILPFVEATLDRRSPREWYYALMDYGVFLKKEHGNPGRRSAHHVRQSPFAGSNRELRSRILRAVLASPGIDEEALRTLLQIPDGKIGNILAQLSREGFLQSRNGRLFVSGTP